MDNIPNLKYKTTLCLSWAQGTPKNIKAFFAKRPRDATSRTVKPISER